VTGSGEHPAQGILDTSAVIAMRLIADPAALPSEPLITTVTLAELSVGPWWRAMSGNAPPGRRTCRRRRLTSSRCPFDRASARAFGRVAASLLRQSGRKTAARAYDALIAATAMAHGLPVYTCNAADFEGIDGLQVVPVTRCLARMPRPSGRGGMARLP
jgi:tRNA(fMet)-specific endonuclease VapC